MLNTKAPSGAFFFTGMFAIPVGWDLSTKCMYYYYVIIIHDKSSAMARQVDL